ncbi:MAG: Co2+/Mg2+ efflux protein ApaG [Rhodospirillales bacterium]|jgi:ApaG protein
MYSKQTNGLVVSVTPEFLEEHSRPDEGRFVWAYHITIVNEGSQRVQLLNRYWKIIDAQGRTQEVRGAGVVGEQPVLDPGQEFSYTSGCPLETSSGVMMGSYEMVAEDGSHFDISIPAFSLDSPLANMAVN